MPSYEVRYKDGTGIKCAVITASNESAAGRAFSSSYPGVPRDAVISVRNLAAGTSDRRYNVTKDVGSVIALIGGLLLAAGLYVGAIILNEAGRRSDFLSPVFIGAALGGAFTGLLLLGAGLLIRVSADHAKTGREILAAIKAGQALSEQS